MKLQIVSNRLPVAIETHDGELDVKRTGGGLATGMSALQKDYDMTWTGWPGSHTSSAEERKEIEAFMAKQGLSPVWISQRVYKQYYRGFSNKVIWPLFHYFGQYTRYREQYWKAYVKVNRTFCDQLLENADEGDIFWINDYHLMLLPQMIRAQLPSARIGFFLHIPFPHYEVYRQLPWRGEILEGLSGADLIGFHTRRYADYFLHSAGQILGMDIKGDTFSAGGRPVKAASFPMGIDYHKFADNARNPEVLDKVENYRKEYEGKKIILSVDRLDYSKGILQRLKGFDLLLKNYPEYKGKISLLELIVPSRIGVEQYQRLKKEIDEYTGRINGRYGTPFWTPVKYFYRSVDFNTLCALYCIADIGLITPRRDGMNLVAKEYVAVQQDRSGVLILSEFAGAVHQLRDGIIVNPNNVNDIVEAIRRALMMTEEERRLRLERMQEVIRKSDVMDWAENFIKELNIVSAEGFVSG